MTTPFRDRIKGLRRVRAGDIRPNPKNWRTHPPEQQAALRGLLGQVGYCDALIARQLPDGGLELVDGHLRAETTPDQKVPVLILDVTEAEADTLLATLDPRAAMAGSSREAVDALLQRIEVDDEAVARMLANLQLQHGSPVDVVEDEVPAPPDAATTKRGDLWILGEHRLLCGDSSDAGDVDRLLAGAKIHLVNTDPPYNVKVEPRSNNAIAAGLSSFAGPKHHQSLDVARHPSKRKATQKKLRAKDRPLENDFVSDAEFDRLLAAWFGNLARVLAPGRGFYIWGGYANVANYPPVLKACGLYFSQAVIWHKQHPTLTRKDFMGDHEWCFYGWREGAAHQFYGPKNIPDVWSVKKVNPQSMVHLTEKPIELAARAMQYSSREGEHVLDLFGGSGSTMAAAEQLGRRSFLMELDPLYCDVIVERWEKLSGKKAKREGAGGKRSKNGPKPAKRRRAAA